MNRFITNKALVLRVRNQGESNREAFFLNAEMGIIRAVVYGGPKSRLRSYVSPFHSGILYLYHDPVRDSYKVSDFDVIKWRPGIRENYERTVIAGAIAETILAGDGGGSNCQDAARLAGLSYDALENAGIEHAERILIHFLWNWTDILGARPEFEDEASCISIKNPGALHWLKVIENLEPALLVRYSLDEISLNYAKSLCLDILASTLGRHLSSWENI
ncbi:MAG: recombination protein O N-terminal domain-containing protein [Spirochaetaceae bacterium]|jgi:DNA repair protein RecO (recombination protein O)|nr:recombination protein O N-terminal domain-containing protein [Spirochaetaceae bacterium]